MTSCVLSYFIPGLFLSCRAFQGKIGSRKISQFVINNGAMLLLKEQSYSHLIGPNLKKKLFRPFRRTRNTVRGFVRLYVGLSCKLGKQAKEMHFVYVCAWWYGFAGALNWVWMGVGRPCPPLCNDIVTLRHLLFLESMLSHHINFLQFR